VVRKYASALGLDRGYSAHSMRATFITTALENGAQLEDVQKAAGHRDPSTTKLYDRRGYNPENAASFSAMVNILGSCLSGATLITDPMHTKKPQGNDIGHCFIAIDPGLFRDREDFTADVTRFCDDLRATKPVDAAHPVMVAGDPQWNNAAKRMQEGIPVGPGLLNQVRQIAQACAAPWLLD